jgi:hypothetical protein
MSDLSAIWMGGSSALFKTKKIDNNFFGLKTPSHASHGDSSVPKFSESSKRPSSGRANIARDHSLEGAAEP